MRRFHLRRCACMAALALLTGCTAMPPRPQPPAPPPTAGETAITVTVGDTSFDAVLYDNAAAAALRDRLPLTVEMRELNGNEKYAYLGDALCSIMTAFTRSPLMR